MFGPLGVPELLFILVLALLIFGPRKLPEIGRTVGKAMGEFRRASTELRRTINSEIALEEESSKPAPSPARPPAADPESTPAIGRLAAPAPVAPEPPEPPEPPDPSEPPPAAVVSAAAADTAAPAPATVDESGVATGAGATTPFEVAAPPEGSIEPS
jgi:TatA/E family protein of Tat protein translocase